MGKNLTYLQSKLRKCFKQVLIIIAIIIISLIILVIIK